MLLLVVVAVHGGHAHRISCSEGDMKRIWLQHVSADRSMEDSNMLVSVRSGHLSCQLGYVWAAAVGDEEFRGEGIKERAGQDRAGGVRASHLAAHPHAGKGKGAE